MKPEGAVRQKLKQVRFRHAKRELEALLDRTASNCVNNATLDVPGAGAVGFCRLEPTKCCSAERGMDRAPSCRFYAGIHTKESVKESLEASFTAPIAEVAAKYPDAAALMWVLTDEPPTPEAPPLMDPFGESGVLVGTFFGVPLWVGTEGARFTVGHALNELLDSNQRSQRDLASMQEEFNTLQDEVLVVRERAFQTERELGSVESVLSGRVQELEDALRRVTEERDALQARLDLPWWSPSRWSK